MFRNRNVHSVFTWYDPVKDGILETKPFLMCTEYSKIFSCFWNNIGTKRDPHATNVRSSDRNVQIDLEVTADYNKQEFNSKDYQSRLIPPRIYILEHLMQTLTWGFSCFARSDDATSVSACRSDTVLFSLEFPNLVVSTRLPSRVELPLPAECLASHRSSLHNGLKRTDVSYKYAARKR